MVSLRVSGAEEIGLTIGSYEVEADTDSRYSELFRTMPAKEDAIPRKNMISEPTDDWFSAVSREF